MKILDALKFKGKPFWIPGAGRDELPEFFKELGFKRGAEIGVQRAANLVKYCEAGFEMYGIDPFPEGKEYYEEKAVERTKDYPNCTLIKKTSIEAAEQIPKYSLDFVYIDGSHEFGYVAMDLHLWAHRVRRGGIIAGHDYYSTIGNRGLRQVGMVVDAFVEANDIENFYVVGTKDSQEHSLSYFMFKNWGKK
jgi:hypothetical protein